MLPKLSKLELRVMEILWDQGPLAVREVVERMPAARRPAYTTIQTVMYRLEAKKALKRISKSGNAHIFEAAVSRQSAQRRLIDEFIALMGGSLQPLMAHLVDAGKLTLEDVETAQARLIELKKRRGRE